MSHEEPILLPQKCEGDYLFSKAACLMTSSFVNEFGPDAAYLVIESQRLILSTYKNPDYLQILTYLGKKYYCIADFHKGDSIQDYEEIDTLYITFMLPEEI